jgi:hypothetical protein
MIEQIELRGKRPHAVAQQDEWLALVGIARRLRHSGHIVDQDRKTSRAEVTQDIGLSGELPVTAMVVGINGITCADEGVRDRTISERMLAHSVRDLNDPAGRR